MGKLIAALAILGLKAVRAAPDGLYPNIVFILADDQGAMLGEAEDHMPKLKANIVDAGVSVTSSFVSTPVCCPARSALYTGKYIHNIGVFNNSAGSGGCSSLQWQEGPEKMNIAWFLQQKGYQTSFAGKYLNNYGYGSQGLTSPPECLNSTAVYDATRMETACAQRLQHVPRGWNQWQALKGNAVYYNYTLSNNGVPEEHGDDYATDYLVDLVANRTISFLKSKLSSHDGVQPVFAVAAVPACHEPADPAPQYADYGEGLTAPRTPNFNAVMNDDARHWMIANVNGAIGGEAMNSSVISYVDLLYRRRLAALQSVDDMIENLVQTLEAFPPRGFPGASSALDETYIIYTADNGYHLGQFAVALDKRQPYDTDMRVPFYARGPSIPAGSTVAGGALVSVDLAPTLLQLSQAWSMEDIEGLGMDGTPMADVMLTQTTAPQAREFLMEYYGESFDYCANSLEAAYPDRGWSKLDDGVNCGLRGNWSFLTPPFWTGNDTWSSVQDSRNNTYSCVRSVAPVNGTNANDTQYCTWDSGEEEIYDLVQDPWQMQNLATTMLPSRVQGFRDRLQRLRGCKGRSDCAAVGTAQVASS